MNYRAIFDSPTDFLRSTRIDLDQTSGDGFIVTPMFARLLGNVLKGLQGSGPRAITVTGPYGSGKSTTVLEVLALLQSKDDTRYKSLRQNYSDLHSVDSLPSIITIPVVGAPGLIAQNLVGAFTAWSSKQKDIESVELFSKVDATDLNQVMEAIDSFRNSHNDSSIVIVIDELGKHIEYAVSHPDDNDIYLLQLIAEYADRCTDPTISFITILHQAFENYSNRLLKTQRDELTKIQGRFEDIPFQLPLEDTIRIVGKAVSSTCIDPFKLKPAADLTEVIGERLYDMGAIRTSSITKEEFLELCRACAPLNPITVLLLGPLFRHFAQNERSLFSMLCSYEPHGFQRFLDDTEMSDDTPVLYGVSDLYEYVVASLGSSVFSSTLSHRWRTIENNLGRVPEESTVARQIVCTTGLISAIPVNQLVASEEVLQLAIQERVNDELQFLQDRSLVVFRKYSNSYRLWDGSDIDIEAELERARQTIGAPTLVECIGELTTPKPITARRHSMQTGALRWFESKYISVEALNAIALDERPIQADGRVYFVIGTSDDRVPASVEGLSPWQIVVWVNMPSTFLQSVSELTYLRWVKNNTSALIDDEVARREVTERENHLEQLIQGMVGGSIFRPDGEVTFYTYRGIAEHIDGKRINSLVSDLCDELYPSAPRIVNEFVNRNTLSSAATAARNDVLRRMLDCSTEEKLGIEGFPPSLPIYLSTLRETGLHSLDGETWNLGAPTEDSPWFGVWMELERLTSKEYISVASLWETVSLPPFGLRRGLFPIIIVTFLCVHKGRVSIMEEDHFLPELTSDKIDLFVRTPEKYKVHLTEIDGDRKRFLETLVNRQVIPDIDWDASVNLLSLVSPLVRFGHRLPDYAKHTQSISEEASRVRQAILNAVEPAELLFDDLPQAVGHSPIGAKGEFPVDEIAEKTVKAVRELSSAYEDLLLEISTVIFTTFGYEGVPQHTALNSLRRRAALVEGVVQDLEARAIAWRMAQDIDLYQWVEAVGSSIMKKTPKSWLDRDKRDFQINTLLVEREFKHYETIASLYSDDIVEMSPIRVGITELDMDFETVVTISEQQKQRTSSIVEDVLDKFRSGSIGGNELLIIASELVKAYHYNAPKKEESFNV